MTVFFWLFQEYKGVPQPIKKKNKHSLYRKIPSLFLFLFSKKKKKVSKNVFLFLLSKKLFYYSFFLFRSLYLTQAFKLKTILMYLGSRQGTSHNNILIKMPIGNGELGFRVSKQTLCGLLQLNDPLKE